MAQLTGNAPVCDLEKCMICREASPGARLNIGRHRRNLQFKKGEVIFREGQPVSGIYFVYSGTAKVHKHWDAGKDLILRFASSGNIMGHRGLGSNLVYAVSATALEPLTVCFIDLDFFRQLLSSDSQLCYKLMVLFAEELDAAEQKMRDLAHMPVKGRVAQALLRLEQQFGTDQQGAINFRLAWTDLADFTAATYETVFRTIKLMVGEGLLRVSKKRISLLEPEMLRAIVNGTGHQQTL
ncbi:Crp/Fnr family transcriptional regulator [Mucilaginibacter boryungensis]|uniref:Crp/Fnr family transcriptional regulator n=1 Tax=Mucilaginibacter boryungensis TaxID=768480 RepID=A0ABR9XE53_9SPHI|nr:Crp/Fnr family transcriptional regulator [Mucilaginibacter boryungensis]MBE9665338.1 Crp/Fnr family transcriptional regulator [Mucilaginibacter boryungensis]